ncbi:MAG: hypothetical protein IJ841_06925, partial [Prevotella sp.]|nr:hypothetical protein [Prevotella sp.]
PVRKEIIRNYQKLCSEMYFPAHNKPTTDYFWIKFLVISNNFFPTKFSSENFQNATGRPLQRNGGPVVL